MAKVAALKVIVIDGISMVGADTYDMDGAKAIIFSDPIKAKEYAAERRALGICVLVLNGVEEVETHCH